MAIALSRFNASSLFAVLFHRYTAPFFLPLPFLHSLYKAHDRDDFFLGKLQVYNHGRPKESGARMYLTQYSFVKINYKRE